MVTPRRVKEIQIRLCIPGAARLGSFVAPCVLLVADGPASPVAGAEPSAAPHPGARHMSGMLSRSLVSHFGRHPAQCAQPILPARRGGAALDRRPAQLPLPAAFVFARIIIRGIHSFFSAALFVFLCILAFFPAVFDAEGGFSVVAWDQ